MNEIDDYNSEYFFNGADELEEYHGILDSFDSFEYSPTEEEKDFAYNIMILEQCCSIFKEFGNKTAELTIAAENAERAVRKFIDVYTEGEN